MNSINSNLTITPSNISKVISALEYDLREMIIIHLGRQKEPYEILDKEVYNKCIDRLQKETGINYVKSSLEDLLPYTDFADLYQILNSHRKDLPKMVATHIRDITPQLEKLVLVRNRIAHNRPLYYDDCTRTEEVATNLIANQESLWKNLKSTISHLESNQHLTDTGHMHNLPIPDYEETGFIGRKKQVEELKRLCIQSPYPVITVFGHGGIGKSAIALKAAYDIIAMPDCPFETVVWTSSKTTQLTVQEIRNIKDAIRSSLEMFQDVSNYLAPKNVENPVQEVLNYLGNFKILLILDNLETVLDERIREFLGNLPSGSKILITSRIGVGAYEFPFRLQPLDEGESIQLLRALTEIRQVPDLTKMPNSKLEGYCRKMKNNPLFIKWFVSAVQAGKRPEEILDQRNLFLEFCMSNVYKYLSEDSHKVLSSMLCIPGKRSQAELAYLNDMDVTNLEVAIQQLRTTTMFTIVSSAKDSSFESKYELADLARDYLSKNHPVRPELERQFRKRQQQLITAIEQMNAEKENDPYSFYTIIRRSQSDVIVAKYLTDALIHARRYKEYEKAEDFVAKARSLAPQYFEVYRVDAAIKVQQGRYTTARDSYEAAIELNARSAPLRFWFGTFLMRYQNAMEEALKEFKEGLKFDPSSVEIQIEIARTNLYLRQFNEARKTIDLLLQQAPNLRTSIHRKVHDINLQLYIRKADYLISQHDKIAAFNELRQLRIVYEACPQNLIDTLMKDKLRSALPSIKSCLNVIQDEIAIRQGDDLVEWIQQEIDQNGNNITNYDIDDRLQGIVIKIMRERDYGFIHTEDGSEFYFRRSHLAKLQDWPKLLVGSKIFFWVGKFTAGPTPTAINIILNNEGV